jgi:hypothetical protein
METPRETNHLALPVVGEPDRRAVAGRVRMAEKKALDREAAKEQPQNIFSSPLEIVDEELFTKGEKLATLERWRQGVLEQLAATSEGMPTAGVSANHMKVLDEIEEAKRRLNV